MTTHVRILTSGHEFVSEGNSTLLEAGLSAGLALGYGCSNGNCGKCRAKVVSGEVEQTKHHDYRPSDNRGDDDLILMCCNTALSDVVLEAIEARDSSEIPRQQITARVKGLQIVNDDVALLHLKTPRTNRLRFLAGQHIRLGGNGIPASKQSISSCPCDDMNLHFQIPRLTGDGFSDHVFNVMKKGDSVEVDGPGGDFVLDENSKRPLVFIAWRTGFGPVKSLIEHAMSLEHSESIHLAWISGNKDDRYLDNLCRSWEDALDDFSYTAVETKSNDATVDLEQLINGQMNIAPENITDFDFYIAGNGVLLNQCREILTKLGLPAEQLALDQLKHA